MSASELSEKEAGIQKEQREPGEKQKSLSRLEVVSAVALIKQFSPEEDNTPLLALARWPPFLHLVLSGALFSPCHAIYQNQNRLHWPSAGCAHTLSDYIRTEWMTMHSICMYTCLYTWRTVCRIYVDKDSVNTDPATICSCCFLFGLNWLSASEAKEARV